jgi:hypothetical protein
MKIDLEVIKYTVNGQTDAECGLSLQLSWLMMDKMLNDIASTWERTRTVTATAPSLASQTIQPIVLAGTTPQKADRIALIHKNGENNRVSKRSSDMFSTMVD